MNEQAQKLTTKLIAEHIGMLIIEAKNSEAEKYFLIQENQMLKQQLERPQPGDSGRE